MPQRRQERVAEQLHHGITDILQRRVRDPRLGKITVTAVDVSPDLKQATVFFTSLGDGEAQHAALQGLQRAGGFLRRELSQSLNMRFTPELHFVLDESWQRGARIDRLLDQIHDAGPCPSPDDVLGTHSDPLG
jgi:ribosome-binding factor A